MDQALRASVQFLQEQQQTVLSLGYCVQTPVPWHSRRPELSITRGPLTASLAASLP